MKKVFNLLLCGLCLLQCLAACTKEPEPKPEEKNYDFSGRRYERYSYSDYTSDKRHFFAIDFFSKTNLLCYHGHDTLGNDLVWHRKDTLPYHPYQAYHILRDTYNHQPDTARLLLWTYLSEDPFDMDEFEGSLSRVVYVIDTTETFILKYDEPEKTFVRVQ